ncbi:class I SAM-dependent methyltransferase [Photobacterium aquimaris]|uniref:Methyltransferase domain protein n=1 Tax=Photobacterium aquimaris TaxID=512643 RepID=A0A1Y6KZH0_9GAMM|nr:class I SAM-dependent methyltransferase [Photobacterium aquimaris]SMY17464.1 Methyltransferase domain protein [Photobacterium aquimaris]
MSKTIDFYHQNALFLSEQYLSLTFEQVHQNWQAHWPASSSKHALKVLDIGAGAGRDALWFAKHHCDVYAIEPANDLREQGKKYSQQYVDKITWLDDQLPELNSIIELGIRFDCILLSAVWMHLSSAVRKRAFRKLSNLLAPSGKLVISLRYGDFSDARKAYDVSIEELELLAQQHALQVNLISELDTDELGRNSVQWQTVVMQLPDDGSGDLIKVRQIIVNDAKSATYKLALLRTLLHIADAHPGAVRSREDNKVRLPLGLVALYWIRQFKRLIDIDIDGAGIQQTSDSKKGLGFVKPQGWNKLTHLSADDLSIGALFVGDEAKALQTAIRDTLKTIQDGPVTFIYQGTKKNTLFQMERERVPTKDTFVLELGSLAEFGHFVLEESLWECLRLYSSWIEPLVVNQWITEMRRYKLNEQRGIALQTYYDCLKWIDESHDTRGVRYKITALQQNGIELESVWSGKRLQADYQVDHCLPFAYWPNNDKWNLLPASKIENNQKRARVPTRRRLIDSRARIVNWWQLAWQTEQEQKRFFDEAVLSLPHLPLGCHNFDDVFEAMGLQVNGVKSRLLVGEW